MPAALYSTVTSISHSNPISGHFRALKTAKLKPIEDYRPVMESEVRKYVASCE